MDVLRLSLALPFNSNQFSLSPIHCSRIHRKIVRNMIEITPITITDVIKFIMNIIDFFPFWDKDNKQWMNLLTIRSYIEKMFC